MYERHELIIGGRLRPATGSETITVVDPATEEIKTINVARSAGSFAMR